MQLFAGDVQDGNALRVQFMTAAACDYQENMMWRVHHTQGGRERSAKSQLVHRGHGESRVKPAAVPGAPVRRAGLAEARARRAMDRRWELAAPSTSGSKAVSIPAVRMRRNPSVFRYGAASRPALLQYRLLRGTAQQVPARPQERCFDPFRAPSRLRTIRHICSSWFRHRCDLASGVGRRLRRPQTRSRRKEQRSQESQPWNAPAIRSRP